MYNCNTYYCLDYNCNAFELDSFKFHKPYCYEVANGVYLYNQGKRKTTWLITPSIVKTAAAVEMKSEQSY